MATRRISEIEELLDVGIALSSERDQNRLLGMILTEARRFTDADAGTLYLVRDGHLHAEVGQCQTFINRWGIAQASAIFGGFSIPIDHHSIAGAAAATRAVVNIPDVQNQPEGSPYHYNPSYDKKYAYSTHSNLAVPMLDRAGAVIGVLQLINAMEGGAIIPFEEHRVKLARALASQAGVALRNAILTSDLEAAHLETLNRLGLAAEWRDKETANHITRVSNYSVVIAEALGWETEAVRLLRLASPMHDVGKLGVPDGILHKPGKLEPEERKIMECHCLIGANIMARAGNPVMQWSYEVALGHHEKWDGTGYPQRLAGEDIPASCRIVALADVYDALSCRRCYKEPFPPEKVIGIIRSDTGIHFDPAVVEALLASLEQIEEIRSRYEDTDADFAKYRDYTNIQLDS